jgi:ribonuclease HII
MSPSLSSNAHQSFIPPYQGKDFDSFFYNQYEHLIGVDEVGRGSLAGPVISCALSLKKEALSLKGLNDSKKLSPLKREKLFSEILTQTNYVNIGVGFVNEIDTFNIYKATLLSMQRSLHKVEKQFNPQNTLIMVDAMPLKYNSYQCLPIIKGDTKSPHIMAASIIAKVTRDKFMVLLHQYYPQYQFNKHKGYATRAHQELIKQYGFCPLHRMSFSPIKEMVASALNKATI